MPRLSNRYANNYHLDELRVACDPLDPRRSMPPIDARHRRILDVGCGAGQTLIASGLDVDVFGVGIDASYEALVLARRLAPRFAFIHSGAEALPFRTGIFDLVICRVALPYMHIPRALDEMARVLARHGDLWLVLHPWTMTVREWIGALGKFELRRLGHRTYIVVNSVIFHFSGTMIPWLRGGYESFQTGRGIRRSLIASGFVDVVVSHKPAYIVQARKG